MIAAMNQPKRKLHPYKYLLWVGIASIVMLFAGFSSAFIVKSHQANWLSFRVPGIFYYSTAVILASSLTIMLSRKAFLNRDNKGYRTWLGVTGLLGILFIALQYLGFANLWHQGVTLTRNVSFSFLYVIVGIHALHLLGGVVSVAILFFKSLRKKRRVYVSLDIDLMNTYWHFMDLLWIYLIVFLMVVG